MTGRRSNHGENSKDGFDFQHYTLHYCGDHLMRHTNRFLTFEIGSAIEGHGAFDDVVLAATLHDKSKVTNLLQVKHSNQTIHETYLLYNEKTSGLKYFDTFLDLKIGIEGNPPIPLEQLDQLIIWTNMPFAKDVEDWFVKYVPPDINRDVLEDSKLLHYQRFQYREEKYKEIAFLFHTRMKLVYEIVEVLFESKKQDWKPKSAAKSYYLAMEKQIIEGTGVDKKFKQEFIEKDELIDEKDRFQKCFKAAMERKFIREKLGEFEMGKLNSVEYRKYWKLNVNTKVQMPWKEWDNEEGDLEEFRKRFVFYVQVPEVNMLKLHMMKHVSNFTEVSELLKKYAFKKMINKQQFDNLLSLVKLRKRMDLGPYAELQFNDPAGSLANEVENFLADVNSRKCLQVNASQDVNCTVSRLVSAVKKCWDPLGDQYLVLNCTNFYKNLSVLQMIWEDKSLVENELKCIIIAAVPRGKSQEIETKLATSRVKAILVGDQLHDCFVDKFDIGMLDPNCKDIINKREIFLSEQQAAVTASDIFGDKLYQQENYQLALDLFQRSVQLDGQELQLDEHFRERNVKQKQTNVLNLMCTDGYQQIIVSDSAGMGKTTELINIAIEMRKSYNDHLIVCLDCKRALRHHDENEDIAYIVCRMTNIRRGAKEVVVRNCIELGKIILLLDGIDEVSDSYSNNLKAMLNTISKISLSKLVFATRPQCSASIQKIFPSSIVCQLEPFNESDQLEYLMSFWKINDLYDENDRTRIEENAKVLIKKFRSMLQDTSFIGIPLQTYMMAVIYNTSIMSKDFEQPKPYHIGNIYKQFVELKFQESIKRQFDLTTKAQENAIRTQQDKFVPDHVTIAQKIYANTPEPELKQLCDQVQTYGLVRLHPSVGFVHNTYFEYFLSLYFLTHATNANQEFVSFMRQNLCESRDSIVTKFMDFHIDEIDPSRSLVTDNSIPVCSPNDFEPPATGRLHPDKLREFHSYLLEHCSETERYTLIRNSFNLSVFNVFEVLYDTLPKDTKSTLKFRFGNQPKSNFINLKLLGGNQFLQLLKILLKKNPENFVRLYLTDFGDDDEDFLEVACRKPFEQVLDWLVHDLIPNLNCEERTALSRYVDRRFDKYLQLIVKHNNAQFLQKSFQHAKMLWKEPNTGNCFLLEHNVLQVFLNTIELPCGTKPLKDEERVKMVHHMYELYQWAYDGQFLPSDNCRNTINNLRIDAIKRAFYDTFSSL